MGPVFAQEGQALPSINTDILAEPATGGAAEPAGPTLPIPFINAPPTPEEVLSKSITPDPPSLPEKVDGPGIDAAKKVIEDKKDGEPESMQSSALMSQGAAAPGPGSVASSFFNQSQFKIDKNTGAARVTYPIIIPPGRNKVQPNLDLNYNSQNSGGGSIFGEGWSISIPYIELMNREGVEKLYLATSTKYFSSSLDGELSTTTVSTNYIARTENGSFNKYTFSGNVWTMVDKNGTEYDFGAAAANQQSDPNNASNIYRWMLNEVTDKNGNIITYSYFKDAGQIYPSSTVYTSNGASAGIFQVDFSRATSTNNTTSSAMGFPIKSNYRISEINAKVNGTWVRKYTLGYTTGDNGTTALLQSIAGSGQNASGTVVSMPSSTFSYQTQTAGWVSNSVWTPLISFTATSSADNGTRIADVNGDGLPDIVRSFSDSTGSFAGTYLNNGAGWTASSTWNAPLAFVSSTVDQGVRIADVNGDALPDFIKGYRDDTDHVEAYINNGSGWTVSSTWNPTMSFSLSGSDIGVRIADVNGDGLPDVIKAYTDGTGSSDFRAYINNGTGWTSNAAWISPVRFMATSTNDLGNQIVDVNGDGLPDIVGSYYDGTDHFAAHLNTGSGWAASSTAMWNLPAMVRVSGGDYGVRLADVNGDGLVDVLRSYTDGSGNTSSSAYLHNGSGWTLSPSWNAPIGFTANGADNGTRIVDVNGDGLPDIIQAYTDGDGVTHYAAYTNNNRFRADLLSGITYPQGGSSAMTYKSVLQITDDNGNVMNSVPYPVYIVSKITTSDGANNVATSTYDYYSGTYYTNGPFDHQFAGFNQVKEADASGNITKTFFHTSKGDESVSGEYQDNFWKIGKPYRTEAYDNASNLYQTTINRWDTFGLGGNAAFVKLASTTMLSYDGLGTHKDKAESYTYENTTGNQTQKVEWGEVTASTDGTFSDTGNDLLTTDITYATSTTGVRGKPATIAITNQSSTKIKENRYYYDTLSLNTVTTGNLTKEENWKSASTYINTQTTYNAYGLPTQQLDPRGKQTNYTYDSYNLYVASTTNALSQSAGYQYDYSTGKALKTTDPNGNRFETIYDGFGRPLQIVQPDHNSTSSTYAVKTVYAYTDTANAVSTRESNYLGGSITQGFQVDTGSTLTTSLAAYYSLEDATDVWSTNDLTNTGSVTFSSAKVGNGANSGSSPSNKYLSTGSNLGTTGNLVSMAGWAKMSTNITGGSNGQQWEIFNVGNTTYNNDFRVVYQNNAGVERIGFAKQRGGIAEDFQYAAVTVGTTWHHVVLTYNGTTLKGYFDNVEVVSFNPAGNGSSGINTFAIMKNTVDNLYQFEGLIDEVGVWTKALTTTEIADLYNGGSGQTYGTVESGATVETYTYYDGIGRLVQTRKSSEDADKYKVSDKVYNSQGLVQKESLPYFNTGTAKTAATSTSALFASYTYDPLQRLLTSVNAVGSASNAYAHWKTTTTDPRGKTKAQYMDAYGNLAQVDEHNSASTYSTYYTYDGAKNLTKITDALGNIRSFSYDGLGRRLTAEDLHESTDTTFGTWNYAYDDAGNLTQTVDPKSQTTNYVYDDLSRVTSEDYTGQGGTEYTYVYDSCTQGIGRLCIASSTDIIASKTYNKLGQLAAESKTIASTTYTTSYTYDKLGNQLTVTNPDSSIVTYTYNAAGLVESVSEQESGASSTVIVSDFDYSPMDQVALQTYANGMTLKNIYDHTRLYRLVGKVTAPSAAELFTGDALMSMSSLESLIDDGAAGLVTTSTVTLNFTGATSTYTVPSDVSSITITAYGAQGATSSDFINAGGMGGKVVGTLAVSSGTTYYINVGGQDGYNGGGTEGLSAKNGGGMTWFSTQNTFSTSTAVLVAGGGGGGTTVGAVGGGLTGGTASATGACVSVSAAGGGSQTGGGTGGASSGGSAVGSNGSAGQGGNGSPQGGHGGGGGYYGGGGGGHCAGVGQGGGAGGSSFIKSTLTGTSTTSGVRRGQGLLTIVEEHSNIYWPVISSLSQYFADATTTLNRGSSTYETSVVFGALLSSTSSQNMRLEVEAQPMGKNFTNIPNVTSSAFGVPNRIATTTFSGTSGIGYHWQARAKDALGNPSPWLRFSTSTYTTDFTFKYFYLITTSTYSGSVGTYTVPANVTKLVVSVFGAQGGASFGGAGGLGGAATGTILVTPGTTYYYNIGRGCREH